MPDFEPTPALLDELMLSGRMAIHDKFMISRLMDACQSLSTLFCNYKFSDAQMGA
jgi:valyl-tRNA synthetase